ncbi:MAG TPA: diguanylate cyclase [Blastocatellia bacterium]|nr:diguanylate cyclase [Blastocatellia bacterium]
MTTKAKHPLSARIFQWAVITAGGGYWLSNVLRLFADAPTSELWVVAGFALAVLAVSLKPIQITTPGLKFGNKSQQSISLSDAVTYLLLVLHGPAAAVVVAGLDGFVASFRSVRRLGSNLFSLAMLACAFFGISTSYELVMRLQGLAPYAELQQPALRLIMPLFAASAIHFVICSSLLALILGLRYRTSFWRYWVDNLLWTAITYFPLSFLSVVAYYGVQQFGWVTTLAATPVLMLIYFSYSQYNQKMEEKMTHIEEMNELHLSIVLALAQAIDAKDNATEEHVERVKIYGRGLARLCGLSELETQAIEAGAMLHDIGKLAVPDYILNNPGKLTRAEHEKIKIHPVVSAEILSRVNFPYPVIPVVRHHHERWDGQGYPDGLQGEDIPITARILNLVDSYDSLREGQLQQKALPRPSAINVLRAQAGTQFDPEMVELFIAHLHEFEAEIAVCQPTAYQVVSLSAQADAPDAAEMPAPSPMEKIRAAHREATLLYEIAHAMGGSLSLRSVLTELLTRTAELIPATTSAVLLQEKGEEQLRVVQAQGRDADVFQGRQMPLGQGIAGWVFAQQESLCNADPRLDFNALQLEPSHDYRASLVAPLLKNQQVLGVLALYSVEFNSYSIEHTRILESIARLAGDAIVNAREHEEMEATALTDRLTGLPNLRAILKEFDRAMSQARRFQQPLSLLMMDLDGFKTINDTLGHKIGDRYLEEVGKVMRAQLRSHEFIGRYAGDEFVAILPNTSKNAVEPLLERLRLAVTTLVVLSDNGEEARAGVSIGTAEYGVDGVTLEALMAAADAGMYADKSKKPHRRRSPLVTTSAIAEENVVPFPLRQSRAG